MTQLALLQIHSRRIKQLWLQVNILSVFVSVAPIKNELETKERSLSAFMTGSQVFRALDNGLSDYERGQHSQQSSPKDHQRVKSSKIRLSPVQPTGPLPALEMSFASANLRAANRIDRDCLDYALLTNKKEKLHRNLSDSRLLGNMGSDSASVSSMKSTYSVLSPIKPKDVRNRYSWKICTQCGLIVRLTFSVAC